MAGSRVIYGEREQSNIWGEGAGAMLGLRRLVIPQRPSVCTQWPLSQASVDARDSLASTLCTLHCNFALCRLGMSSRLLAVLRRVLQWG